MVVVGACGPFCGNGKLNFSGAHTTPSTFTCPIGSSDLGYTMSGTVDADNQTTGTITVKSFATAATVTAIHGSWGGAVGDKTGTDNLPFSPKSVAANSKTTFKFTTPWHCSNSGGNSPNTYADFAVVLTIVTSSGTYRVNLPKHRLRLA